MHYMYDKQYKVIYSSLSFFENIAVTIIATTAIPAIIAIVTGEKVSPVAGELRANAITSLIIISP